LAWPDHGLPVSTTAFLDLTEMAEAANVNHKPMIVHCSAGVGRSGTFCAVHMAVKKLKSELIDRDEIKQPIIINLIDVILKMRSQRPGMVQTKEQYEFCYLALFEESLKLFIEKDEELEDLKMDHKVD